MSDNYDKPFKTFDERLHILSDDRHLTVQDSETAKKFLLDRSYYGLINGFKTDFVEEDKETFQNETMFDDLLFQFQIDNDLKNILFKYALLFEIRFKESMAYVLSRYGVSVDDYLNADHFSNRTGRRTPILSTIKRIKDSQNDPTKYYREQKNHVPAWILFNNAMFGQITTLYSILIPQDKEYVIRCLFYITDFNSDVPISNSLKEYVKSALGVILDFRNNMAHGSRLSQFTSNETINYDCQRNLFDSTIIDQKKENSSCGNDLFCFMNTLFNLCGDYDKTMIRKDLLDWQDRYEFNDSLKNNFSHYLDRTNLNSDFISELTELQQSFHPL